MPPLEQVPSKQRYPDGYLGGEGILPSHAPQGASMHKRLHVRRTCAPVGAYEGRMPSPPDP